METKKNLRKELDRLTVEKVEISRSIADLLKAAENMMEGKEMEEIEADEELSGKLKELEGRRKELVKREGEARRRWTEVLIKYRAL